MRQLLIRRSSSQDPEGRPMICLRNNRWGSDGPCAPAESPARSCRSIRRWTWAKVRPDARTTLGLDMGGALVPSHVRCPLAAVAASVADGPRAAIERLVRPPAVSQTLEATMDQDEDAVARDFGIESFRTVVAATPDHDAVPTPRENDHFLAQSLRRQ